MGRNCSWHNFADSNRRFPTLASVFSNTIFPIEVPIILFYNALEYPGVVRYTASNLNSSSDMETGQSLSAS